MGKRLSKGSLQVLPTEDIPSLTIQINDVLSRLRDELDLIQGLRGDANVFDTAIIGGQLQHRGTKIGFFNKPAIAQPSAYAVSNATTTKVLDPTTADAAAVGNTLAAVIADLQAYGFLR